VTDARIRPMPAGELAEWRAARASAGSPLPEPRASEVHEAVTVQVDGVDLGGALLALSREGDALRCDLQVLQTTLPEGATDVWTALASALHAHARTLGAATISTAVSPGLATAFGRAGFRATMLSTSAAFGSLGVLDDPRFQDDRRVSVRPMDLAERRRFVDEARALLHEGMARAGVVDGAGARLDEIEPRLARLTADPAPEDELLLAAVVDGVAVGSAWGTLVRTDDGLDLHGNTIQLSPELRGRGLGRSFVGAIARHVSGLGLRGVRARVYGYDQWARSVFVPHAGVVEDVHLRKELS
jgi:GNAT superfamily N-acetyltransferase